MESRGQPRLYFGIEIVWQYMLLTKNFKSNTSKSNRLYKLGWAHELDCKHKRKFLDGATLFVGIFSYAGYSDAEAGIDAAAAVGAIGHQYRRLRGLL